MNDVPFNLAKAQVKHLPSVGFLNKSYFCQSHSTGSSNFVSHNLQEDMSAQQEHHLNMAAGSLYSGKIIFIVYIPILR
jgi:hypothetical protein